jgi:glycosyltransferase involved in cell wall biosynthesis
LIPPLRVLAVSYTFPPLGEVGSIRIAQLCRYLPENKIEPIVLTVQEQFYETLDHSRVQPPGVRVLRTPMMSTPLDWYGNLKRSNSSASPVTSTAPRARENDDGFLRRNILALLQLPDRCWGWYLPAVRAAEKFLRSEKVDAIFSSGPPWTSHLVAHRLKRKFGLPWLADFRDPWASLMTQRTEPAWWCRLARNMENGCIQSSDLVLCNTDRLCNAFQRRYPHLNPSKFRTLTNGFEDLPLRSSRGKVTSRRLLLHLGSLYAQRRIDTFLAALAHLQGSGRLSPESFQVIFQGDNDPRFVAKATEMVPDLIQSKSVQFRPRRSWQEAWDLLWDADLLLLFQGNHELQVPAKFYEYLQTGTPIFAVTEEGALADVLQATESGVWAPASEPQEIAEKLLTALQLPRRTPEYVTSRFAGQYHYSGLATRLSLWIKEVGIDHWDQHATAAHSLT